MRRYARIKDDVVLELFSTDGDISKMFHPELEWVDVTDRSLDVGWVQDGAGFTPPPDSAAIAPAPAAKDLDLHAELAVLKKRVDELEGQISLRPTA